MITVEPLGYFGTSNSLLRHAEEIRNLVNADPVRYEEELKDYLASCPMIVPWMEVTDDVLGNAFAVPGGSALLSDGCWVWRFDLVDYLATYHISLPDRFVSHCVERSFLPPDLSDVQFAELQAHLFHAGW